MKVLNKEVEECCMCPCLDHLDMDGSSYCNMLQKDIKDCNIIDKDCPFNKPITKEVIEGFGFYHFYDDFTFGVYTKNMENNHMWNMTYDYSDKSCRIIEVDSNDSEIFGETFIGTINNPIELEFILQNIGIIE